MTEAYAIKDRDGNFVVVKLHRNDELLKETWAEHLAKGYTCVPVTVSEKGEAAPSKDDALEYAMLACLINELLNCQRPVPVRLRTIAEKYLSRSQP